MDASRRRVPVPPPAGVVNPGDPEGDLARCIRATNKIITALLFASLYLLARRWREKSRAPVPSVQSIDHSEIAALASFVASAVYLLCSACIARRRSFGPDRPLQ